MAPRPHLPPLQLLVTFETAARRLNFSRAAAELGSTQSAVSQQMRALEDNLGTRLFLRQHRGVALSPAGESLLKTVRESLDAIETIALSMRDHTPRRVLRISTDFGFAAWWLMPRLDSLSRLMPDVEVRIDTSQTAGQATLQAAEAGGDPSVLFGDGLWPGRRCTLLFAEQVFAVCSPTLAQSLGGAISVASIARLRLLHLESARPDWITWQDWFDATGVRPRKKTQDLHFNNYHLLLQAAVLGQGAALGWVPLIDDLLRDGLLVRLSEHSVSSDRGYYLVEPRSGVSAQASTFRAWLLKTCRPVPTEPSPT